MPDEADIADRASFVLLNADIERARTSTVVKLLPKSNGLCCNDCGDKALRIIMMVPNPKGNLKKLKADEEIRVINDVPTVFKPESKPTRFCSKECAEDYEERTNPSGRTAF